MFKQLSIWLEEILGIDQESREELIISSMEVDVKPIIEAIVDGKAVSLQDRLRLVEYGIGVKLWFKDDLWS